MAERQERRRIAGNLHDRVQQQLYGAQMRLQVAHLQAEQGARDDALGAMAQVEEWLEEAVQATRTLLVDLAPPRLELFGARLELDPVPGEGTQVTVYAPTEA